MLLLLACGLPVNSFGNEPGKSAAKDGVKADKQPLSWYGSLLSKQAAEKGGSNICISPYSLASCLSLLKPGAAGQTLQQLDIVSGNLSSLNAQVAKSSLPIRSANRLYIDSGFKPYDKYLHKIGEASLATLPLSTQSESSRKDINNWVQKQTNDRIKDLLPQGILDSNTRLVAVNAVYMLAQWQYPFQPEATHKKIFNCADGKQIKVDTMHTVDDGATRFYYPNVEGCEFAVAFPYKPAAGKQAAWMLCLMPNKSASVSGLASKFGAQELADIRRQLVKPQAASEVECHIALPKFSFTSSMDLVESLKALGMKAPFSNKADFSAMSAAPLQLSAVIQKSFIAIDEEKTEAAAATAAVVTLRAMPRPKQQRIYSFDRPFLFVVMDAAEGLPYFMGIVQHPGQD